MTALEVILLAGGILCVIASFFVGAKNAEEVKSNNDSVRDLTEQELDKIRRRVDDVIDEQLQDVTEKTEAQLDKISNIKILEMNDYAESVIGQINKNHNEAVFLYDMLNEKAKEVKNTVKDVNMTKKEVLKMQNGSASARSIEADEITQDSELTQETSDSAAVIRSQNKDFAKEKLIELVRQSNEKNREAKVISHSKASDKNDTKQKLEQSQVGKSQAAKLSQTMAKVDNVVDTELKEVMIESDEVFNVENESEVKEEVQKKKTAKQTTIDDIKSEIKFEKNATNKDKIRILYEMGFSNKDIAKELNLGIGEVKLVIDLYNSAK